MAIQVFISIPSNTYNMMRYVVGFCTFFIKYEISEQALSINDLSVMLYAIIYDILNYVTWSHKPAWTKLTGNPESKCVFACEIWNISHVIANGFYPADMLPLRNFNLRTIRTSPKGQASRCDRVCVRRTSKCFFSWTNDRNHIKFSL